MNFLILDTTQLNSNIVLGANKENFSVMLNEKLKPSESLINGVDTVLSNSKKELKDIDVFGCVTGPGSFTGIRIAVTTVKAFLEVYKHAKLVFASVFEIVASLNIEGYVLVPSTSTSFYYAYVKNGKVQSYDIGYYEDIEKILKKDKKVYSLGCEQLLTKNSYNNYETINNYSQIIFDYFLKQVGNNNFNDKKCLEPFYIQLSQAERDLK